MANPLPKTSSPSETVPSPWQICQSVANFSSRSAAVEGGSALSGQLRLEQPALGVHQLRLATELPSAMCAPVASRGEIRVAGQIESVRLLGLAPLAAEQSLQLADAYVRLGDLVARYQLLPEAALTIEAYWRLDGTKVAGEAMAQRDTIDLIASVQTSLLDSHPEVVTRSRFTLSRQIGDARLAAEAALPEMLWQFDLDSDQARPVSLAVGKTHLAAPDYRGCWLLRGLSASNGEPLSYVEIVHPADFVASEVALAPAAEDDTWQLELGHRLFATSLEKGVILRGRVRGLLVPSKDDLKHARAALADFLAQPLPLTT